VMNEGRIEQVGTPDEVFHQPASEFVVSFLGDVNRFHGRVEGGQVRIDALGIEAPLDGIDAPDGAGARVFVRPHELAVARDGGAAGFAATIQRINAAGPSVRLDLQSSAGALLHVTLSADEHARAALAVGDQVIVTPRAMKVFAADEPSEAEVAR